MEKNDIETLVENWLNENKSWFSSYAIENLDMSTVDKWLRINGKKICKCKSLNGSLCAVSSNSSIPKRNSIPSTAFKNSSYLALNKQDNSSKRIVPAIVSSSNNNNNKRLSNFHTNSKLNLLKTNIHRSSSYNCILHNRKFLHVNSSKTEVSPTHDENALLVQEKSFNSLDAELAKCSINITEPVDERKYSSAFSLEHLASNLLLSSKRTNFIQQQPQYHSYDSATSSNLLKFLIKSKIKLPTCFNKISDAEKIKLRKEKNNDFEFILELIKDTTSELNLNLLGMRIRNNIRLLVNAEKVFVYFVCKNRQRLIPFKFDSLNGTHANEVPREIINGFESDLEQELPIESSLIGSVVQSGKALNIPNVNSDPRFTEHLVNNKIKSLVIMPIKNLNNEVIAIAQIINKTSTNGKCTLNSFNENDIQLLTEYLKFCGISMSHAQLFELYAYEYERNRSLLEVIHELFEQQTNIENILFRIMQKAQTLLKCQRCSILVITGSENEADESTSRKAFDLFQNGTEPDQRRHSVENDDGTKISRDLADYVIMTGEKLNLPDAYSDPRFDPLVDTVWRFKTKSILCMPIFNRDGNIIGCAQVANRIDNHPFDENDEQLFEAFCIFCGLAINNTLIYNELEKSMAEKSVALEVLSYHATSSKNEVNLFMRKLPTDENFTLINKIISKENLKSYVFNDFSLNIDEMVLASYEMFKQSGLLKAFQIDKKTLFQWLLTVRKNYRDVEYHNWNHAFNVCQTMFSIFENSSLTGYLQDIEKLALIVGCLCHDLDHRGTNNMFQVESHSALSQLYGTTATMEKHHFNHCIMILNTPGHNIFAHVKPRTYELLISYIKEAILATDLADHFSIRKDFEEATKAREVVWNEEPYCSLLRKNLMTCCDLAAVTKPWNIHKDVVNLVTKEFFAQGDRERLELNKEPNEMMDARRSHELPRLQIGWIDNVCLPLYSNIACLCHSFKDHLVRIVENRRNWSLLNEKIKKNSINKIEKCIASV